LARHFGEIGPENVSWELADHHQGHGLYQKLLSALADEGVLIGVASKNDRALGRASLPTQGPATAPRSVVSRGSHLGRKSGSVARILGAWNIAADAAVFVDDSPMELAEVASAHPGIEVVKFPGGDYSAIGAMLSHLRDTFGKTAGIGRRQYPDGKHPAGCRISAKPARTGAACGGVSATGGGCNYFDLDGSDDDPRVLDLINKTNQFNLNGIRYTQADWHRRLARPQSVLVAVSYQDRFGPLGKIAVMLGKVNDGHARIETWVMSCRAFARRIEHCCLRTLFEHLGIEQIYLDFEATPRNSPVQDFLASITGVGRPDRSALRASSLSGVARPYTRSPR